MEHATVLVVCVQDHASLCVSISTLIRRSNDGCHVAGPGKDAQVALVLGRVFVVVVAGWVVVNHCY